MSFLDKMKMASGLDNAGLQVDIRDRPTKRGDTLTAVARVTAGKQAQKLNYLRVSFEYEGEWTAKNAEGTDLKYEGKCRIWFGNWPNSEGAQLSPGNTLEFPIQIKVPSDSPQTNTNKIKYKLFVRADVEGAKDPESSTFFEITG